MAEMGRASQRKQAESRMTGEPIDHWEPPEVRRVIEITDYDMGEPRVCRMELRRSDRIDCYDCYIDGQVWKRRIGWSRVQEWIRKAFPRARAA
jgi:hypothetical protein